MSGWGQQSSGAANFDLLVVVGMGLGTALGARSPMCTGLVGMKLKEAGEDLGEFLVVDLVADLEERNCRRLADS